MQIARLELRDFRNYESLNLDINEKTNLFFGQNGQGKTNLLEAVYMCSCARSHRTARDQDLVRRGSEKYYIKVSFAEKGKYTESVALACDLSGRSRSFWHDDIPIRRSSDWVGLFHTVMFSPQDLQLICGSPSVRRRFLDMFISQLWPAYFRDLQLFNRLLSQRNSLLKLFRDLPPGEQRERRLELNVWDEQYALAAARIMQRRQTVVNRLSAHAEKKHTSIAGCDETLGIEYRPSVRSLITDPAEPETEEIRRLLLARLSANADDDVLRGWTGVGAHRDDIMIQIDGVDARLYASQGQQRTAVLALKLAEIELMREVTRSAPVLLLDDVLSELDSVRRRALMDSIGDIQVLITCTDRDWFDLNWASLSDSSADIEYFLVRDGKVFPEGVIPEEDVVSEETFLE